MSNSRDRGARPPPTGRRRLKVRVRTAKHRKLSSTRWLERQLNDPYVEAAREEGYRSRAAFKLIELNEKYRIIRPGSRVVDLGSAPGGWSQVAAALVGDKGKIVACDILEMEPVTGVEFAQLDFLDEDAEEKLMAMLGGPADVVLSDMAAQTTGHRQTDHLRIMGLCEAAAEFAEKILAPGGSFCAKVLRGGTEGELLKRLKQNFAEVRHAKPPASRADSAEMYIVAKGFR